MTRDPESADQLPKFWAGRIGGTNRGTLMVRFDRHVNALDACVVLHDRVLGPSVLWLAGTIQNAHADLELVDMRPTSPVTPTDVRLSLDFSPGFLTTKGTWRTDVNTAGWCELRVAKLSAAAWQLRFALTRVHLAGLWILPWVYGAFLVAVALLDLLWEKTDLSYPSLVLLLVPVPFIFRAHLEGVIRIIRESGIKRFGPVEFEQNPLGEEVRQLIVQLAQQMQEASAFIIVDQVLAPLTKILLIWLSANPPVDRSQFDVHAKLVGVPQDNLDATWNALIVTGCAHLNPQTSKLGVTPLGSRYASHLQRFSAPGSEPTP